MTQFLQILIGGLLSGGAYAMVALGFSLIYRVTGVVNLAQGSFCIFGALATYTLQTEWGWPLYIAAPGALAFCTVFAVLIGATVFVPSARVLSPGGMLMVTAGLMTMNEGLTSVVWGDQPFMMAQFSGEAPLHLLGLNIATQAIWILGSLVLVGGALAWIILRTSLGLALRACSENPSAATLMGLSVDRLTLFSFVLACDIAAIGGVMIAPIASLQFDSGRLLSISGFIAVAIGGLGSLPGAIVGGLLFGVAEQLAAAYVSSLFSNAIALCALIAVLLWRPTGLFHTGSVRRLDVARDAGVARAIIRLRGLPAACGGLAAMAVVLTTPLWLGDSPMLSTLVIALILFIAVLGLDVMMGFAGQVNLGQAGFAAIGGYGAAVLSARYDVPPLAAITASAAVALLFALALASVTANLRGHYLALATLAFGLMIDSLAVGLTDVTGGPAGYVGVPSLSLGPWSFETPIAMYYFVACLDGCLVLALLGVTRSRFGRACHAIRSDPLAAAALGVRVARIRALVFCISAVLGSISGSLYAFFFHYLAPEMVGPQRSIEFLVMLVIGGEGTLVGGIFGVLVITLLPEIFQPLASFKVLIEGLLLVLVFRYFPDGLFGSAVKLGGSWPRSRMRSLDATPLSPPRAL